MANSGEKKGRSSKTKRAQRKKASTGGNAPYPRHSLTRVLRIPEAIIAQNAAKPCTEQEAAKFVGVGYNGPFRVEISSCLKFGLLDRPSAGTISITELARKALRPQNSGDDIRALQKAVLNAPQVSDVYEHYRGENLPDRVFFENALEDKFKIPNDKVGDFIAIFEQSLEAAKLIHKSDDRIRVVDVSEVAPDQQEEKRLKKLGKGVKVSADDSCFVMMPFADPIGTYFEKVYAPAIQKTGLKPVRADNEIFGTGKIMDQIWSGIVSAKVLVAELTGRNPNVFYELVHRPGNRCT